MTTTKRWKGGLRAAGTAVLLVCSARSLSGVQGVEWVRATPDAVTAGRLATVTVTALIPADPALIGSSVNLVRYNSGGTALAIVGSLRDDGTSGDAVAGDSVFTTQVTLNEPAVGAAYFKVSVAYRGLLRRVLSSQLVVQVLAPDREPPTITATLTPPPNAAGWNHTDVTVRFACSDTGSGVASCPGDVVVWHEGAGQVTTGSAVDRAGNRASSSVTVNIDRTPPGVTIVSPASGVTLDDASVVVQGTVNEAVSGVAALTCNGMAASLSGSSFTCTVSLAFGDNLVQVAATDLADNTSSTSISVTYIGPRYFAIVDVKVTDSKDFSDIPADYTGLTSGGVCTEPYAPGLPGARVWPDDVNRGIGGTYTTVWVKYDHVPAASTQRVLVNYGTFHWPYWHWYCPPGWERASGTSAGMQGALTTGTWGPCYRNGLCVQYLPMNQAETFITNVALSFTSSSASDCPAMGCAANGVYQLMTSDTYDIHAGCGDDRWMYLCQGRGRVQPPVPTSIDLTDEEMVALLTTYAPRVWLASGESYLPSSVDWAFQYLKREKIGDEYWLTTKQSLDEPSDVLPFFYGCDFRYATVPPYPHNRCALDDVPVYAFWVEKRVEAGGSSTSYVDLVYFLYYPYNRGKEIVWTVWGNHVSDWEHITVRLAWVHDEETGWQLRPVHVYLPAHDFGNAYAWDALPKVNDTHPVVYSASGSHGTWLTEGRHKYGEVNAGPIFVGDLVDWTSKGREWDTWTNVAAFDFNRQQGLAGVPWPPWMSADFTAPGDCGDPALPFCGAVYRWGNLKWDCHYGYCRLENGPTGPVSQSVWSAGVIR